MDDYDHEEQECIKVNKTTAFFYGFNNTLRILAGTALIALAIYACCFPH